MNRNLSVQQILRQKNIPNDIEYEIVQYLPFSEQIKKKKEMIRRLNYWYQGYWSPQVRKPPLQIVTKRRPPRLHTYKKWKRKEKFAEYIITNYKEY
tara:strand:+ start:440 stop:727 length:288 start_codon:yes stop_codon:yes gene_type:complete